MTFGRGSSPRAFERPTTRGASPAANPVTFSSQEQALRRAQRNLLFQSTWPADVVE